MSPDDIDSVVLKLHNFLVAQLGYALDDDGDYDDLSKFMHDVLDPYVTRDRNYN